MTDLQALTLSQLHQAFLTADQTTEAAAILREQICAELDRREAEDFGIAICDLKQRAA